MCDLTLPEAHPLSQCSNMTIFCYQQHQYTVLYKKKRDSIHSNEQRALIPECKCKTRYSGKDTVPVWVNASRWEDNENAVSPRQL